MLQQGDINLSLTVNSFLFKWFRLFKLFNLLKVI